MTAHLGRIYLAGPMTSKPNYNFPAFDKARTYLRECGFDPISPADHDREAGYVVERWECGKHGGPSGGHLAGTCWPAKCKAYTVETTDRFSLEEALRYDFTAICEAGAIAFLPGWEDSTGAKKEARVALDTGAKLYTVNPDIPTWFPLDAAYVRRVLDGTDQPATPPVQQRGDQQGAFVRALDAEMKRAEADGLRMDERLLQPLWGEDQGQGVRGLAGAVPDAQSSPASVVPDLTGHDLLQERRVVDPVTGGAKGQKLAQLGALDPLALTKVAEVAGFGATKYDRFNFAKGYPWSLSVDAAMRHFLLWLNGEDSDPESGLPHLAHFTWHGLGLLTFTLRGLGTDDRLPAFLAQQSSILRSDAEEVTP